MILLNGYLIKPTMFPDGTSQVWKIPETHIKKGPGKVEWIFKDEGEIVHLAQLVELLHKYHQRWTLYLRYLPYGRQDKETSNESTFALTAFATLLNSLDFYKIVCFDPHSPRALELIPNLEVYLPIGDIKNTIKDVEADYLCYPDHGARVKYSKVLSNVGIPAVHAIKKRSALTGKILSYKLPKTYRNLENKTVLIIDDICDGGATFIKLAELLKLEGVKAIHLFVSHGIFSNGTKVLTDAGIGRIFTCEDKT